MEDAKKIPIVLQQRDITCFTYENADAFTVNDITIKSCYANEPLQDVLMGIVMQGEWSHVVLVGGKLISSTMVYFNYLIIHDGS